MVEALVAAGIGVKVITSAAEAIDLLRRGNLDMGVIDVDLPDRSGIDVVRELRNLDIRMPLLVMGATGDAAARVAALQVGADDVLSRPFAIPELVARCRALIRRTRGPRWSP
jgi:DNA-binding response OmpR family regulator